MISMFGNKTHPQVTNILSLRKSGGAAGASGALNTSEMNNGYVLEHYLTLSYLLSLNIIKFFVPTAVGYLLSVPPSQCCFRLVQKLIW